MPDLSMDPSQVQDDKLIFCHSEERGIHQDPKKEASKLCKLQSHLMSDLSMDPSQVQDDKLGDGECLFNLPRACSAKFPFQQINR